MEQKKIFNTQSKEPYDQAKIIGGNPNGIINFNKSNHQFAHQIYKNMIARSWFAEQINVVKDRVNYGRLSIEEKRTYDLVLAQLITNDSIQTNQLMDKMNSYITSPVVNAALSRQAFEESQHSQSYSIIAETICQDSDRIYDLQHHDEELALKNEAVANMYLELYNGDDPNIEDLLKCFAANQILEELVFPGGFIAMFSMKTMPGTIEMIAEIAKDETLSHVPLFKGIFRSTVTENNILLDPNSLLIKSILKMIENMTNAEKRWTKYVTKGLLGFSDRVIDIFVEGKANSVCSNLMLPLLYKEEPINPLQDMLDKHIKGGKHETRENYFERNVTNYDKTGINDDL